MPLFDTSTPLGPLREELRAAVERVLDSGRYILGPEVSAFEQEFAAYCGVEHAVGVANGTEAITIALRAMGVGPGDEVVVPSFTFYASAEAIPPTGATPVFCDIDPDTYCVTADTVRAALTPRTKAVIAVHLFGNVAPVAEIEELGVPVLEDAAQAAGSTTTAGRPGALGTAATFSFFPSKNLGCFGDGGMIMTSETSRSPSERARCASTAHATRSPMSCSATTRAWTSCRRRSCACSSPTSTSGLRAPSGRAPLRRGRAWRARGAATARQATPRRPGTCTSSPTRMWSAWKARSRPGASATRPTTARPFTGRPRCASGGPGVELPATDQAARTHLAIPMSPVLTREQAGEVVAAVQAAA